MHSAVEPDSQDMAVGVVHGYRVRKRRGRAAKPASACLFAAGLCVDPGQPAESGEDGESAITAARSAGQPPPPGQVATLQCSE